jgi:O-antigen ligase
MVISRWTLRDSVNFGGAALIVLVTSLHDGSYFSTSWGWEAMALLGISVTGLVFMRSVKLVRLQVLLLLAMAALVGWVGLSARWSASVPASMRELERDIVYVSLLLALAVFGRYLRAGALLLGLLAGMTLVSGYGLTTRLFPSHFAAPDPTWGYRLAEPLGYWNALGLLTAMALILALSFAAHADVRVVRMAAGAATCVIAPAMFFTFSRGALVAAAAGLVAVLVLDRRRLELTAAAAALLVLLAPLVWIGSRSESLTDPKASALDAQAAGQRYAIFVVAFACIAALLVELAHVLIARLAPSRAAQHRSLLVLAAAVVLLGVGLAIGAGGPVAAVDRARAGFSGTLDNNTSGNLTGRLWSFSNHGRIEHWRVALEDFRDHPLKGSGAGTYEQVWYQERRVDVTIRDAHSIYLEVAAELGMVGLALLLFVLAIPLFACVRNRTSPFAPAAGGVFLAFAVHAGIDWDWEVVCVTSIALVAATAGIVAAPPEAAAITVGRWARLGIVAAAVVLLGFAYISYAGNHELAKSRQALAANDPAAATTHARRASRTLRWSVEPLLALGEAQQTGGDIRGARHTFAAATVKDPNSWRAWLALAGVSVDPARTKAQRRAHMLNPIGVSSP